MYKQGQRPAALDPAGPTHGEISRGNYSSGPRADRAYPLSTFRQACGNSFFLQGCLGAANDNFLVGFCVSFWAGPRPGKMPQNTFHPEPRKPRRKGFRHACRRVAVEGKSETVHPQEEHFEQTNRKPTSLKIWHSFFVKQFGVFEK